jgi:hypothetical protein
MLRIFLTAILMCASAVAQLVPVPRNQQPTSQIPMAPPEQPTFHPERVKPDTVVIEIQGVCSGVGEGAAKPTPCVTQITKDQFLNMVTAIGVNSPNSATPSQRSFAESYIQLLVLADAAEKAGINKDPQFMELMKIVQVRTLGEAYKRYLEGKFGNPSQEEIEAYYKQNTAKFETVSVDRVIVPLVNSRKTPVPQADVVNKAKELAKKIRERAVNGEDMTVLQGDAYKALGLPAPPNTDMGTRRRGSFPPAIEAELFALKSGEVTKIETEPSGLTVYRLRSRGVPTVEQLRAEILKDLHQKNVENTIKAAMDNVHSNLNLDFFTPVPAARIPATHVMTPHPLELHPKNGETIAAPADNTPAKP